MLHVSTDSDVLRAGGGHDHFRQVYERAPIGIVVVDQSGGFIDVNPAFAQMTGYSQPQLMEMTVAQITHPEDLESSKALIQDLVEGRREGGKLDKRYLCKDGMLLWGRLSVEAVRDQRGGLLHILGIIDDITDRVQVEKTLKQSEERFRQLTENIREVFWLYDWPGDKVVYVSPGYETIFGRTCEEIIQNPQLWLEAVHPDDKARVEEAYYATETVGAYDETFRIIRPDGAVRWVRDRGFPIRDRDGKIYRLGGIAEDITDWKLAKKTLHETETRYRDTERRFRHLIEHAGDAFFVIGESGKIIDVNQRACDSLGFTRDELLTRTVSDIDVEWTVERFEQFEGKGGKIFPVTMHGMHRRCDGQTFPVELRIGVLEAETGKLVIILARDVTERETAEQQMRHYQQKLRALASDLILTEERERRSLALDLHDGLGQGLMVVKMRLDLIANAPDDAARSQCLRDVKQLIDDARESIRSLTFQLSPPILHDLGLIYAVEWLAEEMNQRYGINVEFDSDGRVQNLDERLRIMLFRAVRELLINVAKHARVDNAVVSIRKKGTTVKVIVSDGGRGFDSSAITERAQTGFGLFSIRDRIDQLGGTFDIRSRNGKGTRVVLTVPLTNANS